MIAATFLDSNTLINSAVILYFDALVWNSTLEMLGLEDWYKKRKKEKQSRLEKKEIEKRLKHINLLGMPANRKLVDSPNHDLKTTIK